MYVLAWDEEAIARSQSLVADASSLVVLMSSRESGLIADSAASHNLPSFEESFTNTLQLVDVTTLLMLCYDCCEASRIFNELTRKPSRTCPASSRLE
jgi:hypothetical protein